MNERTAILGRMFLVMGLVLLLPCALVFQIVRVNILKGDELRSLWNEQAVDYIPIPAQRGNIYDTNGTLLATNTSDYKLAFDPKVPGGNVEDIDSLVTRLGEVMGQHSSYYRTKIESAPSKSRYIVLEKKLTVAQKEDINELRLKGVILEENFRRKYTFGSLGAHVLGFVNHDLAGRTGVEAYYNEALKGENGQQQVRRDPMNRIFAYVGAPRKQPVQGYSLHTTIDAYIQAIVEDELKAGVERTKANYGTAIVMDPRTGAIKALANYPTYDPNFPGQSEDENRKNYAIADRIEPGSTFKLVTAIAAVEQNKVSFDEIFHTGKGVYDVHDRKIRDHDPLGSINFEEVIQKSSNVATAQIAQRLKPQVFYQYARNMGFGTLTNVDLSGEVDGLLTKPYQWSLVSLPFISHGYEVLTTPLQVAQAYAAFANDGKLMRPFVVERVEDEHGNVIQQHEPIEIRTIAKKKTLKKLLPVFESVLADSGTAVWAQVEGLGIAGKTGTAKKVVDGRYQNFYRASFAGFFPSDDPKYVIYVLLDEPKTSAYGGFTAGPIFRQTATRIAGLDDDIQRKMHLEESEPTHFARVPLLKGLSKQEAKDLLTSMSIPFSFKGVRGMVVEQSSAAGDSLQRGDKLNLILSETIMPADSASTKEGLIKVPELRNMNMRKATHTLNSLGLNAKLIGSGTIYAQYPKAGEYMRKGRSITLRGKAKSMETLLKAEASNDDR